MELRQLEYFVAVAEEANFTRAAERVHISQSGVSAQIRQLERELGAPLIDRAGRVAGLTPAGQAALEPARAALAASRALRRSVDEVTGVVRGQLTVGMVSGCTVTPFFDALAAFHSDHPRVELTLIEGDSQRLVESVRTGEVAAALVGTAGRPSDLEVMTLVSEGLVAAVPRGHPLAAGEEVTLAGLEGHPLIAMPVGTGVRAVFDQACAQAGVGLEVGLQASAPGSVIDLASRGLGVGILSQSMVRAHTAQLVGLPLRDVTIPALLALVWREAANPALAEFLDACREAFGGGGAGPRTSGSLRRQAPGGRSRRARTEPAAPPRRPT